MIYSDTDIQRAVDGGKVSILPFGHEYIQPNSYELTLGEDIIVMYDSVDGPMTRHRKLPYTLKHGDFILGTSAEWIELHNEVCAFVTGKSTLGRHGISVHQTAGFIDCGFCGNITFEITNIGGSYTLRGGSKIGQLLFFDCNQPENPYGTRGNHYQSQRGVTLPWDVAGELQYQGELK